MVAITKPAAKELKTIIEEENRAKHTNHGLRIYIAGMNDQGVTYGLELDDSQHDHDIVLDLGGIRMFIDRRIAPSLQNLVIDFMETCHGQGFVVSNSCSCRGRG